MLDNNEEIDERYETGKIYQIVCNVTGEVYIGSTRQDLQYRLNKHINDGTCSSKQIIERGDYTPSIIEDYPCRNENELLWRERYYYDTMECINVIRPIVTEEERILNRRVWYENNKEHVAEKCAQYREDNKEKCKKDQKKYQEDHAVKIKAYKKKWALDNAERIKKDKAKYRQDNAVMIAANYKTYVANNKEKVKLRRANSYQKRKANAVPQIIICGCGSTHQKRSTSEHEATKKHLKWVANSLA